MWTCINCVGWQETNFLLWKAPKIGPKTCNRSHRCKKKTSWTGNMPPVLPVLQGDWVPASRLGCCVGAWKRRFFFSNDPVALTSPIRTCEQTMPIYPFCVPSSAPHVPNRTRSRISPGVLQHLWWAQHWCPAIDLHDLPWAERCFGLTVWCAFFDCVRWISCKYWLYVRNNASSHRPWLMEVLAKARVWLCWRRLWSGACPVFWCHMLTLYIDASVGSYVVSFGFKMFPRTLMKPSFYSRQG